MRHKSYTLRNSSGRSQSRLLFEVKIDLQDVRSCYRWSDSLVFAAQWLERVEALWTPDMVSRVSPEDVVEIDLPVPLAPPENADGNFLTFLMRHFRIQIWKNENLRMYSNPGESRGDFRGRCRESLAEERTQEMRRAVELCLHRFLELEKRAVDYLEGEEMGDGLRTELMLTTGTVFGRIRDDLSRRIFADGAPWLSESEFLWNLDFCPDVHDRLQDLRRDLVMSHNEINRRFEERTADVESYEIPLRRSDLGVVTKGTLWT